MSPAAANRILAADKHLHELCNLVEACGGVMKNDDDEVVPVGDPDWVDLASHYLEVCEFLGRDPVYADVEPDEDSDDPDE